MRKIGLIFAIFAIFRVFSAFEPLKIALIREENEEIGKKLKADLWAAIGNLESIVSVNSTENRKIPKTRLEKCAPGLENELFLEESNRGVKAVKFDEISPEKANFYLILGRDFAKCKADAELLATARPCYLESGLRPILGVLNICPDSRGKWRKFRATIDLFRHEILHSLGFGLINDKRNEENSKNRLDFSKRASKFVVEAFDCDSAEIEAIPSEDEKNTHLNQEIFKTELMTPVLANRRNYFTNISALILEDTHLDNGRWYSIDYAAIRAETRKYIKENRMLCSKLPQK